MQALRTYLADFISLIFPQLCPACNSSLMANENILCTDCLYNLPYTNFHQQHDNIVAQQFWGKLPIEAGYALYYFNKGGKVQNLVHQFKYNGMQQIGNLLGSIAGKQLAQNPVFKTADYIIPVPLHKKRLKTRGYNQSACFADGLAEPLNTKVELDNLVRTVATNTQTHKSRFARYQNMQEVFAVARPEVLENKHVLLVDDIITTGSTLEACGIELLKVPGLKLSIATIAYAE
ncbi:ComF family protein [Mucilaginibacter phyllosphaerae]|uniref:ComF family protein n=1 Tax=Mucilaginibacter phyllosphaerae TaxID=1812349 RepID=A0A4Y8AAC5_9SPHI|nr:phosphoribosyltransferase family protein [Mucilaginibacter phyllosphaerae]MBB3969954.1 ComF family protein [Mucilaginibacter phyllosphaerae]TEW65323.1 ComF family protein [Mucilaginibacter phyllosphaerae]GGH16579.1 amidophosphoribosyltransferase [Mucilaginibacter phyllosphaerae]